MSRGLGGRAWPQLLEKPSTAPLRPSCTPPLPLALTLNPQAYSRSCRQVPEVGLVPELPLVGCAGYVSRRCK